MSKLFRTKYRIVTDNYNGYEVRIKPWWCPFYYQKGMTNTFTSVEKARRYAKNFIEEGYVDD